MIWHNASKFIAPTLTSFEKRKHCFIRFPQLSHQNEKWFSSAGCFAIHLIRDATTNALRACHIVDGKKHRILTQNYSNQSQNSFIDIVRMVQYCGRITLKFQMRKLFHVSMQDNRFFQAVWIVVIISWTVLLLFVFVKLSLCCFSNNFPF